MNLCRVFMSFTSLIFLACLMTGCGGGSSDTGKLAPVTPSPSPSGKLILRTADASALEQVERYGGLYGDLYSGTYTAPDGVSIDVWVSIRDTDTATGVGTVKRVGVSVQGGTGGEVTYLLGDDKGRHTFWVAINHRGASLTNLTADWECPPGTEFVSCLKEHDTFRKINPRLNAQDANSVIRLFADDGEITVNGVAMKASDFVPPGTVRSPVNLHTASFGGVIVSHMLAENNRPELHNVFFEQVTVPQERPISDGLDNAARMLNILFSACESDTSCAGTYPGIRVNFRNFMDAHHSTQVEIDGEQVYAGGVFDRAFRLVESDGEVGRMIRYIGEIANAYTNGDTVIDTRGYGPEEYNSPFGEQPRAAYGFPQLDGDGWSAFLRRQGEDFFPGITSRTAMICSFGINRAVSPDSLSRYERVGDEPLPGDAGGTKEMFGYGFLVGYRTFLSVCPQLTEETGGLEFPDASNIEAENVIVYRGGLDIKHYFNPDSSQDEIMAYFTSSPNHRRVITHKFLGQVLGQDQECLQNVLNNFWNAADTTWESLGDNCEESNGLSASGLTGW